MKNFPLQKKLTVFYASTVLVPTLIVSLLTPIYYQTLLQRETSTLTQNTLNALAHNIDIYLEEMEGVTTLPYFNDNLMNALKEKRWGGKKQDVSTKVWVEKTLTNFYPSYYQSLRQEVVGTVLLPRDGSVYIGTAMDSDEVENFPYQQQDWYKQAITADGKAAFIRPHVQNYVTNPPAKEVISVARLIKDPETLTPLAVILADANTDILKELINDINFSVDSIRVILDENGEVFFASTTLTEDMLIQIKAKNPSFEGLSYRYSIVSKSIPRSDWKLVVLLSKSQISQKIIWIYISNIIFAGGGLICTIWLFKALSKWIVKPFERMIAVMKKIQRGNMDVRLPTGGNDEVAQLSTTFNQMLDQINDLINREYKAVLDQRNAEYRALQSQIQPHFLFNTLNGFVALNRLGDRKTLEMGILSLSSMLRYTLAKEDWATIEEDFQFLSQYCQLQQLRFQDRLHVEISIGEGVHDVKIPRLLLQPLVENAIIHGVEPSDSPCKLMIASMISKDNLIITIQDNGVGFNPKTDLGSSSIGTANVKERLKIAYPNSLFTIASEPGSGTSVTIKIPQEDVTK
ncbi:sensor histidine kinase [Paenibacillus polymyxa]|uniref:cache domain-containing sensor histidine kinase n=1 Tax=Paenibacillus polymyxa TaxID=1406 RepID=UPI00287F8769|nr:sensor histidine kinase [Paenibacillus polymyxa]